MYIFIESCDRRGGPSLRTTTYRRFIFAEILFSFSTFLHNAKEAYVPELQPFRMQLCQSYLDPSQSAWQ